MTLTISQPCLEFTEMDPTSMVAASARSKCCCQQKHVSVQVLTLDEGDAPERVGSSWAAGASWTFPILPSLLSPGVWTHPAHRLLSHIRGACLRQRYPRKPPSTHTGKGFRFTWMRWERGPGPGWSSRVTFLFLWAKGQRPLGWGVLGSTDCIPTHSAGELS